TEDFGLNLAAHVHPRAVDHQNLCHATLLMVSQQCSCSSPHPPPRAPHPLPPGRGGGGQRHNRISTTFAIPPSSWSLTNARAAALTRLAALGTLSRSAGEGLQDANSESQSS